MDKIILGILMLKRLTSYEIRNIIRQNYKSMCSDSLGSIQATLKKLLASQLITCNTFIDHGVNKKVYSITNSGRKLLIEWLKTPMDVTKGKNMELGKFLLMGLIPLEERTSLVEQIISILNIELASLQNIQMGLQNPENKKDFISLMEQDSEYALGIQNAANNFNWVDSVDDISNFEALTLQFGIDSTKFQIEWFTNLKFKLESK